MIVMLILILAFFPAPALADVAGNATVIDGDSLSINGTNIRLAGIDAPEWNQHCRDTGGRDQPCGRKAAAWLAGLVRDRVIRCEGNSSGRYERLIAVCFTGPLNINRQMVLDGWAMAYRKYSFEFIQVEKIARLRKRGIWGTEFITPWKWRRSGKE